MKRIAVIGAGAVGGYFGGRLAQRGHRVFFVARGATLQALKERGLRVTSPAGDIALDGTKVHASADPAEIGPVDFVLVAVKAWQVPELAASLAPLVKAPSTGGEAGVVLPLQNGVDAASQLAQGLGQERVLGGLCRLLAKQTAPAEILHMGGVPEVHLGALTPGQTTAAAALHATLVDAGVRCELCADVVSALWEKLAFIATFAGIGAAARVTLDGLRETPPTRQLIVQAIREVAAVAAARGARLSAELPDRLLAYIDAMPPSATASLHRDIAAGVPSELEAIVGAVTRHGQSVGVATPIFSTLYACLLPGELRARAAR